MLSGSTPSRGLAAFASLWLAGSVAAAQHAEPGASYELHEAIGAETAIAFRQAVMTASPPIRWVIVDSPGGAVESALDMAELMRARGMSIYVRGLCASSCANYLFVAAKLKVLGPDAIVGWHGSPASEHIGGLDELKPPERARAAAILRGLARKERDLFARLGLDPRMLCAGDKSIEKAGAVGWTMPIHSMARFGVRSVVSLGGDRLIPQRVGSSNEPLLMLDPRADCSRTYPDIGPAAY